MTIKYEVGLNDMIAFNRFHLKRSSSMKKTHYAVFFILATLFMIPLFFTDSAAATTPEPSIFSRVVVALLEALILWICYYFLNPILNNFLARRLYSEGSNKIFFGWQELTLNDYGLVIKNEFSESRISWHGIEKIEETPAHAFIYVASVLAINIPRTGIVSGDLPAFVIQAKTLWQAQRDSIK